ncbi:MAG TPA: UPF0149 family protein [Burkholderiaceae bacterium]
MTGATDEGVTNEGALTEDELDQLTDFLDAVGPQAMSLESVDGFFAALICGPEMVMPSEYLPAVFGKDHVFANDAEAADILGLLMRHWNVIASALLRTLDVPEVYLPVLHEDRDGVAHGNDWSSGFMRGVGLRPVGWRELLDSDEYGGPLFPIMVLQHEHDPDPSLRPTISAASEKREELIQMMIASLTVIYRHFAPHRAGEASVASARSLVPQRRTVPKVGRNDPCPCGSGKKFKHCCATMATQLH